MIRTIDVREISKISKKCVLKQTTICQKIWTQQ